MKENVFGAGKKIIILTKTQSEENKKGNWIELE